MAKGKGRNPIVVRQIEGHCNGVHQGHVRVGVSLRSGPKGRGRSLLLPSPPPLLSQFPPIPPPLRAATQAMLVSMLGTVLGMGVLMRTQGGTPLVVSSLKKYKLLKSETLSRTSVDFVRK